MNGDSNNFLFGALGDQDSDGDSQESTGCQNCGSSDVSTIGTRLVCCKCGALIEEYFSDNVKYGTVEYDNVSCSQNPVAPIMSTRTYVRYVGSHSVRKTIAWNTYHYYEVVAMKTYNYILSKCERYNKYLAVKKFLKATQKDMKKYLRLSDDDFNKFADKVILDNGLKVKPINKEIVVDASNMFKMFILREITRDPVKFGVIAVCFQYAASNFCIYYNKNVLLAIFGITYGDLSKGRAKIQKLCREDKAIARHLVYHAPGLQDYLCILPRIIPAICGERLEIMQVFARRIADLRVAKFNTPPSIIGGILMNCSSVYGWNLSAKNVKDELQISMSTLNKYTKKLRPYVYKI